jgi:hypothetical protein
MPPKCTKCNRPCRGHAGPTDEECTLAVAAEGYNQGRYHELPSSQSETEMGDDLGELGIGARRKTPTKKSKSELTAFAMKEVLHQLGKLTCSMQKLSDDNKSVQAELASIKARSAVATNPLVPVPPVPGAMVVNPPAVQGPPILGAVAAQLLPAVQLQIPSTVQELPVPLSNGARISRKTYTAATTGEFVNLSEFSPNTEPTSVMESVIDEVTGNIVFKTKNTKKAMDNFLTWSRAWAGYEGLLISLNTALYQRLAEYRLFIQGCDAIYHWSAVSSYDQRHRHLNSLTHSFDFNVCNMEIYCCTLNASSIRPNPKACFICGSIDHHMKDCPFQKQSSKSTYAQKKPAQGGYSQNFNSKPTQPFVPRTDTQAFGGERPVLCFNWNNGRCSSPACWRLHVCSGCGGPDPRITCPRCNASKG